jgi:hypothetical protein
VVEADRDQDALAPREAGAFTVGAALGRLMPGVGVACSTDRAPATDSSSKLPTAVSSRQRGVAGDWRVGPLKALPVQVKQPCPYVPCGAQQPVAAIGPVAGETQPDVGGAVHQSGSGVEILHIELMFAQRWHAGQGRASPLWKDGAEDAPSRRLTNAFWPRTPIRAITTYCG